MDHPGGTRAVLGGIAVVPSIAALAGGTYVLMNRTPSSGDYTLVDAVLQKPALDGITDAFETVLGVGVVALGTIGLIASVALLGTGLHDRSQSKKHVDVTPAIQVGSDRASAGVSVRF